MSRVFISYAASDEAFSKRLRRALADRGAQVFDPHTDMTPGTAWDSALLSQLRKSDLVIFVVPRYEGEGKKALYEIGAARAVGKPVVSILPDQVRRANNDVAAVIGRTYSVDAGGDLKGLADQVLSNLAA